jgi:hypothetical protein
MKSNDEMVWELLISECPSEVTYGARALIHVEKSCQRRISVFGTFNDLAHILIWVKHNLLLIGEMDL